jgi:hypothetical protein
MNMTELGSNLKQIGVCATCGECKENHVHIACNNPKCEHNWAGHDKHHVFVACFAAPDVQALLKEHDDKLAQFELKLAVRLKEKDAEIQRLELLCRTRYLDLGNVTDRLIAFQKRDAKLANEIELATNANFYEKKQLREEFYKIVRVLRGETDNDRQSAKKREAQTI